MAQRAEEVECAEAAVEAAVSDHLEVVRSRLTDLTLTGAEGGGTNDHIWPMCSVVRVQGGYV